MKGKKVFSYQQRIYCDACIDHVSSLEVCCSCKQPITDTIILFNGRKYHKEHFCCDGCKALLNTEEPILKCGKHTLCQKCADINNNKCFNCKAKFGGKYLVIDGNCFHFECFICNASLSTNLITLLGNKCNRNIGKSDYKYDLVGQQYYHAKCFDEEYNPYCEYCSSQVNEEDEVQEEGKILHRGCVEDWRKLVRPIQEYLLKEFAGSVEFS